ncbi:MAG: DNA-formamidopyrimidine glycosylase [Patescibacteria group bacterium]
MPELPEVETIRNQLLEKIRGKKIKTVDVKLAKMIQGVAVKEFRKIVEGATIKDIQRRAKLLIINLSNGYSLVVHLKLTGQIIYQYPVSSIQYLRYTHIIYTFSDGSQLFHNDMRQFGYVKLIKTSDLEKLFKEEKFGPEPLERDFTFQRFKELLSKKPRQKIKPLLMDQTFLAGVGNVYAQEACWCAKISPTRLVKNLSEKEIEELYDCLTKILKEAIKYRGSSVDTYVDICGQAGDYISKLKVYDREGQKCLRCGGKIKKIVLAGRGTYYCPICQK